MSTEQAPAVTSPPVEEVSMAQVEELLQADEAAEQAEIHGIEPEEPEEAPEPEKQDQQDQDAPRGDLRVALREERERRRQAEQVARQAEQVAQQTQQQQRALAQYLAAQVAAQNRPPQPQQPPPPNFENDPAGYLKWVVDQQQQQIVQMRQYQQQAEQQQQAERTMMQAQSAVVGSEEKFAAKNPDYYDAVDFMRDRLKARFKTLGVTEDRLDDVVATDLRQFGLRALQHGANPAEKIFELAKIEGYNGRREANEQRLSRIAQGSAASRGARSSAPASNGELTLEAASKMPLSKIAAMSEREWARLMGGA